MATHDYNIANQGFPAFRTDLNNALSAIVSNNSSATEPATTFAHMIWVDTAADPSVVKMRNADDDAWITLFQLNQTSDVANLAVLNLGQTFTSAQRGTVTTDNDLSFDMAATNNFKCTPTGNAALTFTNITAGQSGFILLDNSGAHTVSAAASTKVSSTALATISAAGIYLLSYFSDGTNVYVVNSGALS